MKASIGNKIREMRLEKGFSQEELAEQLHISRSALQRMENGISNSWANHLENLCRIFKVPMEAFMKNEISSGGDANDLQKSSALPVGSGTENRHTNEKVIAQLEARLQEKDEIIAMLQEKS